MDTEYKTVNCEVYMRRYSMIQTSIQKKVMSSKSC